MCASTQATQGDTIWISTESKDVLLYPSQSTTLVLSTNMSASFSPAKRPTQTHPEPKVPRQALSRQETKDVEAIANGNYNSLNICSISVNQLQGVSSVRHARVTHLQPATVEPDKDRPLLACGRFRVW